MANVSVIIPAYNAEAFIADTIRSITKHREVGLP